LYVTNKNAAVSEAMVSFRKCAMPEDCNKEIDANFKKRGRKS